MGTVLGNPKDDSRDMYAEKKKELNNFCYSLEFCGAPNV